MVAGLQVEICRLIREQERFDGRVGGDAVFFGCGMGGRGVAVDYGDEGNGVTGGFQLAEDAQVVAAEGSCAYDRCPDG